MASHARAHTLHPRDRLGRPLPPGHPNELEERLEPGDPVGSLDEVLARAVERFNQRRFYEAHTCFEYIWKSDAVAPSDRSFWKGLTQLAAACCHIQRENAHGALKLLQRSIEHLAPYPSPHHELSVYGLVGLARALADIVREHGARPDLPFPPFPEPRQGVAYDVTPAVHASL